VAAQRSLIRVAQRSPEGFLLFAAGCKNRQQFLWVNAFTDAAHRRGWDIGHRDDIAHTSLQRAARHIK
jgi:hypothetical protein